MHPFFFFFFFNDTATTEIYPLSLHDALPICSAGLDDRGDVVPHLTPDSRGGVRCGGGGAAHEVDRGDRKSTRLNSSHSQISYAVFCLKKKKKQTTSTQAAHLVYRCLSRPSHI